MISKLKHSTKELASAKLERQQPFEGPKQVWQSDVVLLDGGVQLAILWAIEQVDKDSLPTGYKSLYINPEQAGQKVQQEVHAQYKIHMHDNFKTVGDLILSDKDENTLAFIESLEITTGTSDLIYRDEKGVA